MAARAGDNEHWLSGITLGRKGCRLTRMSLIQTGRRLWRCCSRRGLSLVCIAGGRGVVGGVPAV